MQIVPFQLPSGDGFPLRGKTYLPQGGPAPGVLIVHGYKGFMDWGFWSLLAERLAVSGLAACLFNLSGSGIGEDGLSFTEQERFERNTYSRELQDIAIVLDRLAMGAIPEAPTQAGKIGLLGHSRGGGMALLTAAREARVQCLATWSAIATVMRYNEAVIRRWRQDGWLRVENARTGEVFRLRTDLLDDIESNSANLDILGAAGELRIPTLVVHGEDDDAVPIEEARRIAEVMRDHGELLVIPDTGHTYGARHPLQDVIPGALEQTVAATAAFFQRHMLGL